MRYPIDRKLRTRERILKAASAAFRRHGYAATGIDTVMASAKLTAGAFYAHFRSKQALLGNALDEAFRQSRQNWPEDLERLQGRPWIRRFASFYLSLEHRDDAGCGCPMPSLTAEIWRNGEAGRKIFQQHLGGLVEMVAQQVSGAAPDRVAAIAAIALSVGGLMLARTVRDDAFSQEILEACGTALVDGLFARQES